MCLNNLICFLVLLTCLNNTFAQYISLDTIPLRTTISENGTYFYPELHKRGYPLVIKNLKNVNGSKPITSLYLSLKDKKGGYPLYEYVNFGIFKNSIFSIVYDDRAPMNWEYRADMPGWIHNSMNYYLEVNKNKDLYFKDPKFKSYLLFADKLKIENYGIVTDRRRSIFNYDFIVEDNNVFLITHLEDELYVYKIDNVNSFKDSKWSIQHCIHAPFNQEYFMITTKKNGQHIIHTKTQGEFLLSNFATNPNIKKINDEPLGTKVFLEDKRTNDTYQLTRNEFNKIKSSKNHTKKLDLILKNKLR